MTKAAAIENTEQNIRANVICPGLIETAMADRFTGGAGTEGEDFVMLLTPMKRRGTSLEIAEMILWLSSDVSSYSTGVAYPVDGGVMTL